EANVTVGWLTNYESIREDTVYQFAAGDIGATGVLTTLIDLYALPKSFPGHNEAIAQGLTGGKKAALIEQTWKAGIGQPNFFPYIQVQCRPIGNMHKTIDFIGDLKSDGCFKWHTPSHGVQKCQKAFIFGGFQAFSMGRL